jgi:hypothetical protein
MTIEYLRRNKRLKKSKTSGYYYVEIDMKMQGISVKLFFSKASKRGKWHGILTTDSELNFDQVFKIYSQRWMVEVFFKEAKQNLNLGKCES